ncbi:MAG: hypothetical protein IT209_10005 [Armatimonadetes bacterium]|nr:hypothetical protein [Armatimonadota bacterium]
MPLLVRTFIKTSLAYLVLSVLVAALLFSKTTAATPVLTLVYYHLFMVGWLTQLVFGVAVWMFPVFSREKPRGNENVGWIIYGFLNLGLLMRVVSEPWHALRPNHVATALMIVSAILQVVAGWLFVWQMWPRVKGPKPPPARSKAA